MGQALYRKYRPRSFSEVVGQQSIVETLQRAIASGRISHAYLFSGPKGVGKTSVARILAHEVNKLSYSDESIHLDIIEIDGASNRRIDEIRDLRDKVNITPTSSKYKVYIIDEVHMLTKEAFNALLKTLEEPPAHVIFILATTEAHKLPETIISRTQHFNFKPLQSKTANQHIAMVAKKEKIDIEPEAIDLLAEAGDGSFRDTLNLLDQLSHVKGKVRAEDVRGMTGLMPTNEISLVLEAIADGDLKAVINWTSRVKESAHSPARLAAQISEVLRQRLIDDQDSGGTQLLKDLLEVSGAKQPLERLEVALLEAANRNHTRPEPLTKTDNSEPRSHKPEPEPEPEPETPISAAEIEPEPETEEMAPQAGDVASPISRDGFELERWPEVLELTRQAPGGLHSALRQSVPRLDGDRLELVFGFPLHQKKVAKAENLRLIGDYIERLSGQRLTIDPIVEKLPSSTQIPQASSTKTEELDTISSIFGSAEVLES
jgi:DNA polymerase III subunit gamma/tau